MNNYIRTINWKYTLFDNKVILNNQVDDKLVFNLSHLSQVERMIRVWLESLCKTNTESVQLPTHKMSELLRKSSKEVSLCLYRNFNYTSIRKVEIFIKVI